LGRRQTWEGEGWSACGKKGLGVQPRKGDALLFWSLKPNGLLDTYSKHAGCPVIRGTKWTATKWMHVGPYSFGYGKKINHVIYAPPPAQRSATCFDKNDKFCQGWAEQGECIVNPLYMEDECKMSCSKC
jgi:prolyl 4-hydroxylase